MRRKQLMGILGLLLLVQTFALAQTVPFTATLSSYAGSTGNAYLLVTLRVPVGCVPSASGGLVPVGPRKFLPNLSTGIVTTTIVPTTSITCSSIPDTTGYLIEVYQPATNGQPDKRVYGAIYKIGPGAFDLATAIPVAPAPTFGSLYDYAVRNGDNAFTGIQDFSGATLLGISGNGISSLNGATQSTQTFADGTNVHVATNATTGQHTVGLTGTVAPVNGGLGSNAVPGAGKIPIGDGSGNYVPGDPLVQGLFAEGSTSASNPVAVGGYDAAGTPALHGAKVLNGSPAGSDYGIVTRPIPSGTQAVSASSLPLPTGAAQDSTLSTISAKLPAALDGSGNLKVHEQGTAAVSVVSLPLPAGAATAAKQPAPGTAGTPSADVVTVQGGAGMTPLKVDGSGVTQPVSASSLPLPTGAAQDATLTGGAQKAIVRGGAKGTTSATDVTSTASGANHQPLDVAMYDASGNQITTFGGGTQYAQGTTQATPTGTPAMAQNPSNVINALKTDASGNLLVNVNAGGASGGTSSTFGVAFPGTGTATGFKDSAGVNMQPGNLDASGNVKVNCASGCAGGSSTPADTFATPSTAGLTLTFPMLWNGATFDRQYGDKTNGAFVNVKTSVLPTGAALDSTVSAMSAKLPAALDGSGFLKTHEQGTAAISAASLPLPSGAATAAKQPALGTAGTPSADVITVQGAASMIALKTDSSATTQPVSAVSLPLPTGAAQDASLATIDTDVKSNVTLHAGSNLIGKVGIDQSTPGTTNAVQSIAGTTGGGTVSFTPAAATTNATNVKNAAGTVYQISASNTTATLYYLRMYNLSTAPTCSSATGFIETIPIPASTSGGGRERNISVGQAYSTGIGFCITGGATSTDNTAAAVGVFVTITYK